MYALTFVYRKNVISRDTKVATDLKNTTCTSNIPVYLNVRHTNNDSTLEFDSKMSLISLLNFFVLNSDVFGPNNHVI